MLGLPPSPLSFRQYHARGASGWFLMGLYRIAKWPIKRHLRTIRPQSQKVIFIGCQSVRQWSRFLSLRTDVRA